MTTIRVPTPLRPYTDGLKEVEIQARSLEDALRDLTGRYPALAPHLYGDDGELRPYVNIFVNDEDIRNLQGRETRVEQDDRILIVPSIAGGTQDELSLVPVDHAALRTNQTFIIGLLLAAFIADAGWLAALVGLIMLVGTAFGRPGFILPYRFLRRLNVLRADVLRDHPEPHRFSQGLGGGFLAAGFLSLTLGATLLGWVLAWIVIALAALNLFGGFCVGCAVYYWLNRAGIPGFTQAPPPETQPGRRPPALG